ncbi:MAG: hypothetical protein Q9166_003708 [cf. Caloplaca sp. 2 TL-2023]
MALDNSRPTKRPASAVDFDIPNAKRRSLAILRQSKITWDLDGLKLPDVQFHGNEEVELLLTRSVGLALEAVGFEASEALALESFRLAIEEYIHDFLADVRQSMLSCRRTQATASDFLQALHTHQLSLRALIPHLDVPVARKKTRIALYHELQQEEEQYSHHFLGAALNGAPDEQNKSYVPPHFPPFPSKHTYKATAEFPSREEDPRKIRERATEEGRLGEEALRRLVSAKSSDRSPSMRGGQRNKPIRQQRDELWKETMQAVSSVHLPNRNADTMDLDGSEHGARLPGTSSSDYGRISSAVNADKKYWRKPAPARASTQGGDNGVL